jgi:hypothetical protein
VNYHIDDLTEVCVCEEGNETRFDYDPYEENGYSILCECKFVFNGNTFELIKQGWEKIKIEGQKQE